MINPVSPVRIVGGWEKWRKVIDEGIDRVLSTLPEAEAVDVAGYIARGGKRIRGFLVLAVSEALGGSAEKALDAAIAVELVHAASLALDDIIDGDRVRRGRPAAWVAYGVSRTVMVSNLLIPFAQRLVYERYGVEALTRTVDAWLSVSRGEVLDAFIDPEELTPDQYLEIARLKTGALFRLSAELGAIAAGRSDVAGRVGRYGELLGVAYQVADDMVDYVRETRGERVSVSKSYILFKKYIAGDLEKALGKLRSLVEEAAHLAQRLLIREPLFHALPGFIVNLMLAEVGMRLGR